MRTNGNIFLSVYECQVKSTFISLLIKIESCQAYM